MQKSVLITGATRGLGQGMALEFARRGYKLALTGRNPDDLAALGESLQALSPQVCVKVLDVTEFDTVAPVIRACATELGGLDIVVANAGLGTPLRTGEGAFSRMRAMIDVNLTGAIATADAAIELFLEQGRGQLVGISSVAGVRGMANTAVYSATKSGLSKYLEALRCEVHDKNIAVTDLAPGYIDTDINRAMASRPFLVSAEKGTAKMVDFIEKRVRFRYVPPWPWMLVARVLKCLPASLLRKL